jgi:hypothetical protein
MRTNPVICFQVVNVLAEDERPEILAKKLDHVKCVVEPGSIP